MDWFRYLRATEAGNVEHVENQRLMQMNGKIKSSDISAEVWAAIRKHDQIIDDTTGTDGD